MTTSVNQQVGLATQAQTITPKPTYATPQKSPNSSGSNKSVIVAISSAGQTLATKPTPPTVTNTAETFAGQGQTANTVQASIALTFSTNIKAGTSGANDIVIKDAKNNVVATFAVTDNKHVAISGNSLTITAPSLNYNSAYTLSIASGVINDTSNNSYAGTGKTAISFKTIAAATITTQSFNTFNSKPAITGTAAAGSTVTISNGNQSLGTTTADSKGNWTFTPASALKGANNITASYTEAGNTSGASNAVAITVESTPTGNWSWISGLTDSKLIGDFTAFANSSVNSTSLTQANLSSALSDFSKDLGSTLTTSQFNDLSLINSNLSKVGASSYVQYITNAFMNGTDSKGDDYYSGGSKTANIGKLTAKSTATSFTDLYNKWFLGKDYPTSGKVTGSTVTISGYSATNTSLFSQGGPTINDINQGQIGDCYYLASLSEVANQNSSIIQNMITDNGNGTYGVKFNLGGSAVYETIDNTLPAMTGGAFNTSTGNDWGAVLEKAYAQLQSFGDVTGNGKYSPGSSYASIGNGGYGTFALGEITGATKVDDFFFSVNNNTTTIDDLSYQSSQFKVGGTSATTINGTPTQATLLTDIQNALAAHDDVLVSSRSDVKDGSGNLTLVADHQFAVEGIDKSNNELILRNPWGTEKNQYWNTTFDVSLSDLAKVNNNEIIIDNVNDAKTSQESNDQQTSQLITPSKTTATSVV